MMGIDNQAEPWVEAPRDGEGGSLMPGTNCGAIMGVVRDGRGEPIEDVAIFVNWIQGPTWGRGLRPPPPHLRIFDPTYTNTELRRPNARTNEDGMFAVRFLWDGGEVPQAQAGGEFGELNYRGQVLRPTPDGLRFRITPLTGKLKVMVSLGRIAEFRPAVNRGDSQLRDFIGEVETWVDRFYELRRDRGLGAGAVRRRAGGGTPSPEMYELADLQVITV